MKKLEIRQMIQEELAKLNEAQKYPTQDEAEAMSDWYMAMNNVYIGAGGKKVRAAFEKADDIRIKLHTEIFGDKSPWALTRKGNKSEVVWHKHKAERLGI